jgi:phosphoribosylformimino-5-aminoimidazole carboxamide ribotide isomerase
MLVIPAIDLYGGRCVRLHQGSFSRATLYSDDPAERAREFADRGARWIHVVDLDAAEGKGAHNRTAIARVRAAAGCRLEVGGGVRTAEDARAIAGLGVERIVVGTALVRAPAEVARWASSLGRLFVGGIDARDGRVKVSGWTEDGQLADTEAAGRLAGLGLRGMIYTNIARDGTLAGPDIEATRRVAAAARLPTVLSGGIGSRADVEAVFRLTDPLIAGVIVGKALYEGAVDLGDLLESFSREPDPEW